MFKNHAVNMVSSYTPIYWLVVAQGWQLMQVQHICTEEIMQFSSKKIVKLLLNLGTLYWLELCKAIIAQLNGRKYYFEGKREKEKDLQSTLTLILLLTAGGTPLDAIHIYAPISSRLIRVKSKVSPSHSLTAVFPMVYSQLQQYSNGRRSTTKKK